MSLRRIDNIDVGMGKGVEMGGVVIVIWCDTLCGVTKSTIAVWIVLAAAEHVLWLKLCTGSLASRYIVLVCIHDASDKVQQ